jgi:hypothetical protein
MLFVSRKREERVVLERRLVNASPPKPMSAEVCGHHQPLEKPLDVDTWAIVEAEKRGGPTWQPFITVPESLGSMDKESMLFDHEKKHPLETV